jgi:hypothetical protein
MRRRRRAALWILLATLPSCYTTAPLAAAPTPGTEVLLDLNDRGRVELGDRIGPGAATIQATLDERTDSLVRVRVGAIRYLNGQTNAWSGEPMVIPTRLVSQSWQRTFSRARAYTLGAAVAGALVLLIRNTSFLGGSSGGTRGDPGGGTGSS